MSEHPLTDPTGHQPTGHESSGHQPTGHRDVDAVVASLDELEERPVADHVAVFESADERLRAALAGADVGAAAAVDGDDAADA